MSDTSSQACALLADALGLPMGSVGPETRIGVTPEWDSMAHMRLILAMEALIGHSLSAQSVLEISSYEDVVACFE